MAWKVGVPKDLDIVERATWDGDAAKKRIFAWAGWPDDPKPSKARRAFLVYNDDPEARTTKAAYKLPICDVVDGELVVVSSALAAAASRLPQTDAPESVLKEARKRLEYYQERWRRMKEGEKVFNPSVVSGVIVTSRGPRRLEYKVGVPGEQVVEGREVTGIANVFGIVDDGGDLILPGSFQKSLAERRDRIAWLWSHDARQPPVAVLVDAKEVDRTSLPRDILERHPEATGGVQVTRRYLDTPRGNEVLQGIKDGAIKEMSFGFDPVRLGPKHAKARRTLAELRVWEFSDVVWGMNPATMNTDVKGLMALGAKARTEYLAGRLLSMATDILSDMYTSGGIDWERMEKALAHVQRVIGSLVRALSEDPELRDWFGKEDPIEPPPMAMRSVAHILELERLAADIAALE